MHAKPGGIFPTRTLASLLHRDGNNFDLIRLLAALSVMVGHAYGITGGSFDPAMIFTHHESLGSLAVFGFFLISGLLVTDSWARQRDPARFALLRVLRIYPGAMVCALFVALFVGPIFTASSLQTYFAGSTVVVWLAHNLSLLGTLTWPALPNVFCGNRIPCMTNATAWTLPLELGCYVLVLLAGWTGAIGSRWKMPVFVAVAAFGFFLMTAHPPAGGMFRNFFALAPAYSFYPIPFFLLGMLLYAFKDEFLLHGFAACALIAGYSLVRYVGHGWWLLYPVFAYAVLWLAAMPWLRRFKPKHDYSYGIYLYGFVVQQALWNVWPQLSVWPSLLVSVPLAAVLAMLSWHHVERPCLQWARNRRTLEADYIAPVA